MPYLMLLLAAVAAILGTDALYKSGEAVDDPKPEPRSTRASW